MLTDHKIIMFFNQYLSGPKSNINSQELVRALLRVFTLNQMDSLDIIKYLIQELDICKKAMDNTIRQYSSPPAIQVSADTEEGKQLIKNLMEMYKNKEK